MPRKPGPGRTEYNNAWNRQNPEAAKTHRQDANVRHMGAVGSAKREIYNLKQASNRRIARRRRRKAKAVAAKLLALATVRAQIRIQGFSGKTKLNCI